MKPAIACASLLVGVPATLSGTTAQAAAAPPALGGVNPAAAASVLYVSPSGTGSASGTRSNPTTLTSAISRIAAGGTIYLRGGTYAYTKTVTIPVGGNGTSGALRHPRRQRRVARQRRLRRRGRRRLRREAHRRHRRRLPPRRLPPRHRRPPGPLHQVRHRRHRPGDHRELPLLPQRHVVRHCIAYRNGHHGFTYNSDPGTMTVSHNVGVDNAERNYSFDTGTSVFRSDTSCRFSVSGSNDKTAGDLRGKVVTP